MESGAIARLPFRRRNHDSPLFLETSFRRLDHHALGKEAHDGCRYGPSNVTHELGPEARINKIARWHVLRPPCTDQSEPVVDRGGIKRPVQQVRVGVTIEVPGRIDKGVLVSVSRRGRVTPTWGTWHLQLGNTAQR